MSLNYKHESVLVFEKIKIFYFCDPKLMDRLLDVVGKIVLLETIVATDNASVQCVVKHILEVVWHVHKE